MIKILILIVLVYFAYKVFLGPETTIKIERNAQKKNIKKSESNDDDYIEYEEVD